jgi:mRNA interferase MazF
MPKRGEVWYVNLGKTVGNEIKKTRPAVVVSSDYIKGLNNKIIIPITGWKDKYSALYWMIRIEPDKINGLTKASAAVSSQIRSVDITRFEDKIGKLTDSKMEDIVAAVALCIEYEWYILKSRLIGETGLAIWEQA